MVITAATGVTNSPFHFKEKTDCQFILDFASWQSSERWVSYLNQVNWWMNHFKFIFYVSDLEVAEDVRLKGRDL